MVTLYSVFTRIAVPILAVPLVKGLEISTNTVLDGNVPANEAVTINSGAYLALIHGITQSISGDLKVDGSLFIGDTNSADPGMKVTLGNIDNSGTIVIDNRNATTGSTLNIGGSTFENDGYMYVAGSSTGIVNSWNIQPVDSIVNKGTMQFSQDKPGGLPEVVLIANSIINDGTICLKNAKSRLQAQIDGNGCINVGDNAMFVIKERQYGVLGNQTLYMSSNTSVVYAGSAALTDNIHVAGFGNGNFLTFRTSITGWNYDANTGILSVNLFIFINHQFNIGKGYNPDLFQMRSITNNVTPDLVNNALVYEGVPPDISRPSACAPCQTIPWIPFPLEVPPPYTTTVTQSNSTIRELVSFYSTLSGTATVIASSIYTLPPLITEPVTYTKTVTANGTTITQVVTSFPNTITSSSNTISLITSSAQLALTSSEPSTSDEDIMPPPFTTILITGSTTETVIISYFTTTDSQGDPSAGFTRYPVPVSSLPSPYTTTLISGSSSETDIVSFYTCLLYTSRCV